MNPTSIGFSHLLCAKIQAEAMLAEPKLYYVRGMLRALALDAETPGLPHHIVERCLDSMDRLVNHMVEQGRLVR